MKTSLNTLYVHQFEFLFFGNKCVVYFQNHPSNGCFQIIHPMVFFKIIHPMVFLFKIIHPMVVFKIIHPMAVLFGALKMVKLWWLLSPPAGCGTYGNPHIHKLHSRFLNNFGTFGFLKFLQIIVTHSFLSGSNRSSIVSCVPSSPILLICDSHIQVKLEVAISNWAHCSETKFNPNVPN